MDTRIIEYLQSGRAWLLVGSGPSIQMGYPDWSVLASVAVDAARNLSPPQNTGPIEAAMRRGDYPGVFEAAVRLMPMDSLLERLRPALIPKAAGNSEIYKILARWPIPVYLTTNYDDELQSHLTAIREPALHYGNSSAHMNLMRPDLQGAIFKLHGDLRSADGLILTSSQYDAIASGAGWTHFRTKLAAVFQTEKVIVVGYSLTDKHVRHILAAAKEGSGVINPVIWIAPDVTSDKSREYLETHRIEVLSYSNSDGTHRHLFQLLRTLGDFVPARTSVTLKDSTRQIAESPSTGDPAAPGLFVFTTLHSSVDYDSKHLAVIAAAAKATLTAMRPGETFDLHEALSVAGWPAGSRLDDVTATAVIGGLVAEGLLESRDSLVRVAATAPGVVAAAQADFEHIRDLFRQSLAIRIQRDYREFSQADSVAICKDIDSSFAGFFRHSGLSLVTTLLTPDRSVATVPLSLLRFVTDAAARYGDYGRRQAFVTTAIGAIAHSERAERDYLGRLSQGYFAFHMLGAFGAAASQRLVEAKQSVWLLDSSLQIPALAVGAPTHATALACLDRLRRAGIRLVTTELLFDETAEHLWFANMVVEAYGGDSAAVIASARGDAPYWQANVYLGGFVNWRAATGGGAWSDYLAECFGDGGKSKAAQKSTLARLGVEVIAFQAWPGFSGADFTLRGEYIEKIGDLREGGDHWRNSGEPGPAVVKKVQPEAEAVVVVRNERTGRYYLLTSPGVQSPAWFISSTAVLNLLPGREQVTWQPEAFLRFAGTLFPVQDDRAAEEAFGALLWGVAQAGLNILDNSAVERAFGARIEEDRVNFMSQRKAYDAMLARKYGEPIDVVMSRVPLERKTLATQQISNELSQALQAELELARSAVVLERARANAAQNELVKLEHFRRKLLLKTSSKKRRRSRKTGSKSKKKGR